IVDVKTFKDKLPQMIEDLNKVSNALAPTRKMIDDNERLSAQAATDAAQMKELEQKVKDQTAQLSAQTDKLSTYEAQIAKLFPVEQINVTIQQSSARQLIPNALTIGVEDIEIYNKTVDARINGGRQYMYVNDPKEVRVADRTCTVDILRIDKPNVEFLVACSKN
ncbi:MAG: hypothetical protein WB689_28900, partial [Xanthobacteraceae bacterium]